jgi:hypothetical protein
VVVALAADTPPAEQPGIPASEVRALRDLVRGVARAAPLLETNPARCRAMVRAAIRRYDAARGEEETPAA